MKEQQSSGSRIRTLPYSISMATSWTHLHPPASIYKKDKKTYWSVASGANHEIRLKLRDESLVGYIDIHNRHATDIELYVGINDGKHDYIKVYSSSKIAHNKIHTYNMCFLPGSYIKIRFKNGYPISLYNIIIRGIPLYDADVNLGVSTYQLCVQKIKNSKAFSKKFGVREDRIDQPMFPHDQFDEICPRILESESQEQVEDINEEQEEYINKEQEEYINKDRDEGNEIYNCLKPVLQTIKVNNNNNNENMMQDTVETKQKQQEKKVKKCIVSIEEALERISPLTSRRHSIPLNELLSGFSTDTPHKVVTFHNNNTNNNNNNDNITKKEKHHHHHHKRHIKHTERNMIKKLRVNNNNNNINKKKHVNYAEPICKPRRRSKLNGINLHQNIRTCAYHHIPVRNQKYGTFDYLRSSSSSNKKK